MKRFNFSSLVGILALPLAIGIPVGLGGFTFIYGEGHSYLTNDPKACMNCHVMSDHFKNWTTSSHRNVAVCNDCHAPTSFMGKYLTKAYNGFQHSWAFTMDSYREPLQIKDFNKKIAEQSCRNCHEPIFSETGHNKMNIEQHTCTQCHKGVGHSF